MEKPSTMKIAPSIKKRLGDIGNKNDTYEDLIRLLLNFKEAHKKQWKAYTDSIMRGD